MTKIAALSDHERFAGATVQPPPPTPARSILSARFLGGFEVAINHSPVTLGTSRRNRALLAFLIDRGTRPTPRDLLMNVFWPDAAPDAARNSLHVAMSGVRKALARAWTGTVIECRGDTYRISEPVEVWTDAAELVQRCDRASAASADGRVLEAIGQYEQALALYRGEFLDDEPYLEWAQSRREELRLRAVTCADRLSELHLRQGDLHRTLEVSTHVLREEPCHEAVARRLMVTYARLGQPHMALRQYDRIVGFLHRQLGVAPAPETVALADGIRRRLAV
jgi:DNA-binding SARP family transcriptional activator